MQTAWAVEGVSFLDDIIYKFVDVNECSKVLNAAEYLDIF